MLIGRLTRDPELTTTGSGVSLCRFSIAVNRAYRNQNGEYDADFINIVAWRGLADTCSKWLTKGRMVAVCGSIQSRSYEVDGQKRYSTEVVADDVEFLSRGGADAQGADDIERAPAQSSSKKTSELKPVDDEGLPF